MPRGFILVDWTDQGRRAMKDAPDRFEAAKPETSKLGVQIKEFFYTPSGSPDAIVQIEAEGPEAIAKYMSKVQALGNVKLKFIRSFSIEEMRKMI
jgi:uncharacterized protein with GYD domain